MITFNRWNWKLHYKIICNAKSYISLNIQLNFTLYDMHDIYTAFVISNLTKQSLLLTLTKAHVYS